MDAWRSCELTRVGAAQRALLILHYQACSTLLGYITRALQKYITNVILLL